MAVEFVDRETGEVIDTEPAPKKRKKKGEEERIVRVNLTPLIIVGALIIGFLVGGGVATVWQQQVDKSVGYTVDCE